MEKQIPIGFVMALSQRPEAVEKFASLSEIHRQEIINGAHSVSSKAEMRQYVNRIISEYK